MKKNIKPTGFHGYFGGKNSIQSFIVPYIPNNIKTYIKTIFWFICYLLLHTTQ